MLLYHGSNTEIMQMNLTLSRPVKAFGEPSPEWATFVLNNRNRDFQDAADPNCNNDNKYDIVTSPVANDDIALLFRTFSNGVIQSSVLGLTNK